MEIGEERRTPKEKNNASSFQKENEDTEPGMDSIIEYIIRYGKIHSQSSYTGGKQIDQKNKKATADFRLSHDKTPLIVKVLCQLILM